MARSRRAFLSDTTKGLLALAAAGADRSAVAQTSCGPWGALPDPSIGGMPVGSAAQWTCSNHPGYKILEVWLDGGASPWETFWIPGTPGSPDFAAFGLDDLPIGEIDWSGGATSLDPCAGGVPDSFDDLFEFGEAADSKSVFLGPAAMPLWSRADIVERMRIVTLGHPLLPHQAAYPYALAGLPLGNPRRAGTGAAVQRRYAAEHPGTVQPTSFIIHKGRRHIADPAAAIGTHPGSARPLTVALGSTWDSLATQLERDGVNPASDPLFDALRHGFADRMRAQGQPVRSAGFESYRVAAELVANAGVLQDVFAGVSLSVDTSSTACPQLSGQSPSSNWHLATELDIAAHLLSADLARYCCVVDYGIGNGYDTHPGTRHLLNTSANLLHVCRQLAGVIYHPTVNPSGPIDLADTLIVINSEFGRTPEVLNAGRNHWPDGYLSVLIGGPVTGSGAGVRGGFDAAGMALAAHTYTPTDLRGALLLAGGIDAFAPDTFRVDDFSSSLRGNTYTEDGIRSRLVEVMFGV